jgi:hypothetical protein
MNKLNVLPEQEFTSRYQKFIRKGPKDRSQSNISTRAEVITYSLKGWSKAEIAEYLHISVHTVPQYRSQTFKTFGVGDFNELQQLFEIYAHIWKKTIALPAEPVNNKTKFHNLPISPCSQPIGRNQDIAKLLNLITKYPIVWLKGIGGVGKTTTLLQLANHCLQECTKFDAIIYVSAQTEMLTQGGKVFLPADRTLFDIYRQIFKTFDRSELMYTNRSMAEDELNHDHFHDALCKMLEQHHTLLIFDNFDTEENYHAFRQVIHNIPASTRMLVSSRQIFNINYYNHELPFLSAKDAEKLICNHLYKRNCKLPSSYISQIVKYTGGLPLAIEIVTGLIAMRGGDCIDLERFFTGSGYAQELLEYCLDKNIDQLKHNKSSCGYQILQAIAIFPDTASKDALINIAGLTNRPAGFERGITQLLDLSLIMLVDGDRYKLHQVVHTYMNNILVNDPPTNNYLRQLWMQWYYNKFVSRFDEQTWEDWQDYQPLEIEWLNISAVVDWCFYKSPDQYQKCIDFWNALKGFTMFRGRWQERNQWLKWLIKEAEFQNDAQTLALALYHQSLTRACLDETDYSKKAMNLALAAWDLNVDFNDKFNLITHIAMLHIRSQTPKSLILAGQWLKDATKSKQNIPAVDIFKIKYYQAELEFNLQNIDTALSLYQGALALPISQNHPRFVVYAQGRIAKIFIAQDRLTEAEELLINSLGLLTANKDARGIAFCQFHLAVLRKKQANKDGWMYWSKMAINSFQQLNMDKEARALAEMQFVD